MSKLNYVLLSAVLGLFLNSCSTDQTAEKNIALIDQYVTAVEAKDVDAMAALLDDNYKGYGPSVNDSTNKEQAVENWKFLSEEYYDQIKYDDFQNIAVTIKDGPRKGDWVSNWALLTITYKDGRGPVNLYVNVVYKIKDGKIIHSRTFYNEADVLEQLGYRYY